jgi:hypothetical protein
MRVTCEIPTSDPFSATRPRTEARRPIQGGWSSFNMRDAVAPTTHVSSAPRAGIFKRGPLLPEVYDRPPARLRREAGGILATASWGLASLRYRLMTSQLNFDLNAPVTQPQTQAHSASARPVNLLVMDGGGIKGRNLMVMVEEMERDLGVSASSMFELMGGTSIGGAGAMFLACVAGSRALDLWVAPSRCLLPAGYWAAANPEADGSRLVSAASTLAALTVCTWREWPCRNCARAALRTATTPV